MTISRSERLLAGLVLAATVQACDAPAPPEPKAPADSLAAILQEPDSDALSTDLGRFMEARKSDPAGLDREMRAAGFRRLDARSGCARYAFTGEPKKIFFFLDHTLHILIKQCGSNPLRQTISIRRGDS